MQIDKSFPIPASRKLRGARIYPFDQMEIGDSVLIDRAKAGSAKASAIWYGNRTGKKFITRDSDQGRRIWRVS